MNPKYIYIPLLSALTTLITGCTWLFYDRVQEFDDEFTDTRKVIARMDVLPVERRTEINSARIIFEREYSDRNDFVKAYFVIARSSESFQPAMEGFMKIDDDTWEISLDNILSEHKMSTETSSSSYSKSDSTGVSSGSSSSTDTDIWIDDKFMFPLTDDMISKIREADKMMIRFYFGPVPGTFRIRGMDLGSVKRILAD